MIGVADIANTGIMDRKRRQILDSGGNGLHCLSTPPKWHSSLKRHYSFIAERESTSLYDITQLLVDSGYVTANDIHHLSQTCSKLHQITNRQSVWLSLCEHKFPGSAKEINGSIAIGLVLSRINKHQFQYYHRHVYLPIK
jgi:hypothetical protein